MSGRETPLMRTSKRSKGAAAREDSTPFSFKFFLLTMLTGALRGRTQVVVGLQIEAGNSRVVTPQLCLFWLQLCASLPPQLLSSDTGREWTLWRPG